MLVQLGSVPFCSRRLFLLTLWGKSKPLLFRLVSHCQSQTDTGSHHGGPLCSRGTAAVSKRRVGRTCPVVPLRSHPCLPPKCLTPYHLVVVSWDLLRLKLEALSDTWPLYFLYCIPAFHLATTENGRRKGKCQRGMAFFCAD